MLMTLHEYAEGQLVESGEVETLRKRHADYYMTLAEEGEIALVGSSQTEWLNRLAGEHANFRAAIAWGGQAPQTQENALRTASALWSFCETRGHVSEGRQWLQTLLAHSEALSRSVRAKALRNTATLAADQSDYAQATSLYEQSLVLCRQLDDQTGIANVLNGLGTLAIYRGDYAHATQLFEAALAKWQLLHNQQSEAKALNNLAVIASVQGGYERALMLYQQSSTLFRVLGDKVRLAHTLGNMASIANYQGNYALAITLFEQSLALHRELADRWGIANALAGLGYCARQQQDYSHARNLYRESLLIQRAVGDQYVISAVLEAIADLLLAQQEPDHAVRVFAAADQLRTTLNTPLLPIDRAVHEQNLTAARLNLGEDAFTHAWLIGQAMTMTQALDFALTAISP